MSRHLSPLSLPFTMSVFALSACDESPIPTGPRERPSLAAAAAVGYTAQDMDNPYAGEGGSATSINTAGQVVGSAFGPDDTWRGWIWQNGVTTRLGTLGGRQSWGSDINDLGQVVGYSETPPGKIRAFRWVSGTMRRLATLGGSANRAFAINNRGHVVGQSQLRGDIKGPNGAPIVHAFLLKTGVGMTDLGTLGGSNSSALDINDAGQVVGWSETTTGARHPFLWQNGVMKDLLPPGSANSTGTAIAITQFGVVVGERNSRAFRYAGGVMRNLPLGTTRPSAATGIRAGRIVGSLTTPTGQRGFVLAGGQVTLLPLLHPEEDEEEDNAARAINGAGVIVGSTQLFDSNQPPTMWTPQ
jgi:probable HAF family extracellular repeat protein